MSFRSLIKRTAALIGAGIMIVVCQSALWGSNSISAVINQQSGTPVHLTEKIVASRLWGDRIYIVEPDRSAGIGILYSNTIAVGSVVTVDGTKTTLHGEPFVNSATITVTSNSTNPDPLGLSSKSFYSGLFTTGRRVRVWGTVTSGLQLGGLGNYFTIRDGGPDDVNIYVGSSGVTAPGLGRYIAVTGISGLDNTIPVVQVASASDVSPMDGGATGENVVPVNIPEWVSNSPRKLYASFSVSDVASAIDDGANVVEVQVKDGQYAYYPSNIAARHPVYGNTSILQDIITYAHGRGVKIVGAMTANLDAAALTTHADWRRWTTNSSSWLTCPADQVWGCLNTGFGDYLMQEIVELAQMFSLDGVSLKGYQNSSFCYCATCRAKYTSDTGKTIPNSINLDSADYRQYLYWQDAQIIDHMRRMQSVTKMLYPQFAFFVWSANSGRYSNYQAVPHTIPTELNLLFDCAQMELWSDENNLGNSIVPLFGIRYMSALTRHRQWIAESQNYTHSLDQAIGVVASSLPDTEAQYKLFTELTANGVVSLGTSKRYLRESLLASANARSIWTSNTNSLKWAAMVVSEPTRQYYGRTDAVSKYMENCFGFFRALNEEHLPVDIITGTDLRDGLANTYKVLILPNTACLSSSEIAAIRSFVAAGGGLVATGNTSLFNEVGAIQPDFALADLFKCNVSGALASLQTKVTLSNTLFTRNESVLSKIISPTGRITSFAGKILPVTVAAGGISLATVCTDNICSASYPFYVTNDNVGSGRVAFFPAYIDAGYYRWPYTYQRVLLQDAVKWVANSTPPVTVVGPKSLQTTFFTQNNGKRRVIHLLNSTDSGVQHSYPGNSVPVREEVIPMRSVEVWFEDVRPVSVKLQPENTALTPTNYGSRTRYVVPTLQQHSMVVAELP